MQLANRLFPQKKGRLIMQKKLKKYLIITGGLFLIFILFTVMVKTVDVQPVGPDRSKVGLASVNQCVFKFFGVNLLWYDITDWLGVFAIVFALGFAVLGLFQLIKRKSIQKVDCRILLLGVFYVMVIAVYLFFEVVVVNDRPIILSESLEASFPSSHVMFVNCIMATAMLQFHYYLRERKAWLWMSDIVSVLIITATVIGRLISGVHWFTDIVAGILLSSVLIALYCSALLYFESKNRVV